LAARIATVAAHAVALRAREPPRQAAERPDADAGEGAANPAGAVHAAVLAQLCIREEVWFHDDFRQNRRLLPRAERQRAESSRPRRPNPQAGRRAGAVGSSRGAQWRWKQALGSGGSSARYSKAWTREPAGVPKCGDDHEPGEPHSACPSHVAPYELPVDRIFIGFLRRILCRSESPWRAALRWALRQCWGFSSHSPPSLPQRRSSETRPCGGMIRRWRVRGTSRSSSSRRSPVPVPAWGALRSRLRPNFACPNSEAVVLA
jgi:hypothetical protein